MERELTGQRDGQAWKSHQINDEKFRVARGGGVTWCV